MPGTEHGTGGTELVWEGAHFNPLFYYLIQVKTLATSSGRK